MSSPTSQELPPLKVGDLVQVWNNAMAKWGDEAQPILEVITTPMVLGTTALPVGAVRVNAGQGGCPLWVLPDSAPFLLRRLTPAPGAPPEEEVEEALEMTEPELQATPEATPEAKDEETGTSPEETKQTRELSIQEETAAKEESMVACRSVEQEVSRVATGKSGEGNVGEPGDDQNLECCSSTDAEGSTKSAQSSSARVSITGIDMAQGHDAAGEQDGVELTSTTAGGSGAAVVESDAAPPAGKELVVDDDESDALMPLSPKTPKSKVMQVIAADSCSQSPDGLAAEANSNSPGRSEVLQELDLMLQVVLSDGVVQAAERCMCDAFFRRHKVETEELLGALSVLGWSFEDWERGQKSQPDPAAVSKEAEEAGADMGATSSSGSRGAPYKAFVKYAVPDRGQTRVLIIGPGFGRELNPRQGALVEQAGYQIGWVLTVPNPETPGFQMPQHLPTIQNAIREFQPHVVACASKGGAYMLALWQYGMWTGPTLMLNRFPGLAALPPNTTVVFAHGSNDNVWAAKREDLEALARTSSPNRSLLYYTCNSGPLHGSYTRYGDAHNMDSLLQYDCLPRLIDAAVSPEGPEMHLMRSWTGMLAEVRLDAEEFLGYDPRRLQRHWTGTSADTGPQLVPVPVQSKEFEKVFSIFRSLPTVARAYPDVTPGLWENRRVRLIERVENASQLEGSVIPYFDTMQRALTSQGLEFEPGIHTRWAFHGSNAVESIIMNPVIGFQPLTSGGRSTALWGPGTYFARDARYAHDGGFCPVAPDGSLKVLLCLVTTGMTCLGDPQHNGVLPIRQGHHRYNSSVDSLSNPEIYITQLPGAAYPAYVITFA
eukprot:CAMPEP_0178425042 /NCGR_PEP_ID=MMETSP0689_2-20121128/28520_1 /TAXON_ID=160604 /ORGANISM="Amphidinium massartii, Strain CS-259" /LENGTH=829 /DNA_ID=CAMNT_0020046695 /DNA_START=39 /DNA_END=2528 /DNA_ORIENTATION=-